MNRRQNKLYLSRMTSGDTASAPSPRPQLKPPARILGIDAALRCTGYGLIELRPENQLEVIDCGVIRTSKEEPLSECLRRLRGGMAQLLDSGQPAAAALEGGFFHRNVKTAMVLGMTRGVVIATIAEAKIPVYEYAPRQIKQGLCGYGNAGKQQITLMIEQMLQLSINEFEHDAADAMAAALTHISLASRQGGLFLPPPV